MKKVLVLCHGERPLLGHLWDALSFNKLHVITCMVGHGEPLPQQTDEYDGLIIMGSPAHMYEMEKLLWLAPEIEFVKNFCATGKPVFGICFGLQMLAHIFGGKVHKGAHGHIVGYHPFKLLNHKDPMLGDELAGGEVCYYHMDTFLLKNGERLAEGHPYLEQINKFGDKIYGVQFHPETTDGVLEYWRDRSVEEEGLLPPELEDFDVLLARHKKFSPQVQNWLEKFIARLFA